MAKYEVARLDEIDEMTDGREPWRPVRHHLGITAFGATAWTGREAGDRIINEHDEADEDEELYVVLSGRARFELDGDDVDAPAGTFVFARPGVKRTAFAEEPGTTIVVIGAPPGQAYQAERLGALGAAQPPLRGRRVRGGGRPRTGARRGAADVPDRPLQRCVLREPRRQERPTRSRTSSRRSR